MTLDLLTGRQPDDGVVMEPDSGQIYTVRALRRLGAALCGQLPDWGKLLVLVITGSSTDTIAVYLECLRAGHTAILVDGRLPDDRLRAVLNVFQPDAVVDGRTSMGDSGRPLDAAQYRPGIPVGRAAVLLRRDPAADPPPPGPAVLLATSGSLGEFRFACLTADNLASNAAAVVQALALRPDDRGALSLSLAFVYGLSVLNSHLAGGGAVVLIGAAPSSSAFWPLFDRAQCTTLAGVPETYRILDAAGHHLAAHPTLRLATHSGGRMPESLVVRLATAMADEGKEMALMYGQTEAAGRISCHRGDDVLRAPRSVGTVIPGSAVSITGPGATPCADEQTGEIVLSGPGIMLGYARRRADLDALPDAPPSTLDTGDLGYFRQDRLYVVGRNSRLAKPLGIRVPLDEVEEVFAAAGPAAVVADENEVVIAYVEGAPETYRPAYRAVLAGYQLPPSALRVRPIAAIPRTITGKIAYTQLRSANSSQGGRR